MSVLPTATPGLAPPPEAPIRSPEPLTPVAPAPDLRVAAPGVPPPVRTPAQLARVLHVVNGEHYSGAERVQDLLGDALPKLGYSVAFASLKAGKFGDHRTSIDAPLHEFNMRGRWDLGVARRIARLVRTEGFSLIHAHTPRSLLVSYVASRLTGAPLVYHVHSPASRDSTRRVVNFANDLVERGCAGRASQLLTVSPTLTDHMLRRGVSPDKLRCVLNGVPAATDDFAIARRRRRPLPPYVIGMVALFRPRKGAEVLLDAIAALRKRDIDVKLEAIGPFETPEYEEKLHQRVKKLNLIDHVHWAGFTDDVHGALAKVDALALPSLFGEGLPMVVLEAMAAGLPVVATRCEGTTEAILHRETGFLVEPGSVNQLTDALAELFGDDTDYPMMSLNARRRHADRFSDEAMAQQVAAVYAHVLKG